MTLKENWRSFGVFGTKIGVFSHAVSPQLTISNAVSSYNLTSHSHNSLLFWVKVESEADELSFDILELQLDHLLINGPGILHWIESSMKTRRQNENHQLIFRMSNYGTCSSILKLEISIYFITIRKIRKNIYV